jgi:uncharacterized membrane protein
MYKLMRKRMLTGLLIVVPIFVTYIALKFLYNFLDGLVSPYVSKWIDYRIPGLGIIILLLAIYIIGMIGSTIFAQRIIRYVERAVARMPLAKSFYFGTKQLLEAAQAPAKGAFKRVVLVEFPQPESYSIGFVTAELDEEYSRMFGGSKVNVFVPTSPNPIGGFMMSLRAGQYKETSLTIEEGMKLIVSGGIILPSKKPGFPTQGG